jgi:predicted ATPase/DNA-binding SARP family transcriptional activator
VRVLLLGPFEVRGDDDRPIEVAGTRLRALLARLAMEPGRVVPAGVLATAIWDDRPPAGGANALQALVSRVRRAIGSGLLERRPPGYRLVVDSSDVDAIRFEQLVAVGRETANLAMLREAEALWRGPALSDLLALRFAAAAAVRLEQLRLSATEERLAIELAAGNDILDELRPLAAAHPLAEPLQGLLIRALYATGRQADALEAYKRIRDRLADELGIDPSTELTDLQLAILRHDPDLSTHQRRSRTNLRAQLTSFIGREDDLAQLATAVGAARLVTVIGPGGAGKTRLAVEVAARATATPDGVWLVELAAVTDPLDVASAVLRAIGTREVDLLEQSTHDVAWRLVEFFSGQRALLILDNCEHLVAAVAELVDRLLGSCPELRILATSRESLAIGGEHLYPIRPLRWPAQERPADDPADFSAVRLFVERATAVRPDFVLDHGNTAMVVEICRRLDGLPLAIELAAARMRALNVEQIAAKLDDRFSLLSSGNRTALPRHRTLRAVIEWSWALLSESERELAMRLAVFPAGTTLDGIADDDVDVLASLVDKSLVERTGERYRMLETIRSYALERLAETGRATAMRAEHARYFLQLTEAADADLRTADQIAALARLTAEHGNIVAALRFAVEAEDIDLGVRLLAAMFWFWHLRGSHTDRLHWTQAVLDIPGETPDGHRAVLCVLRGLLQYETGAVEAGERAVAMGIELSTRPGGLAESPGRTLLLIAPAFLHGPTARTAQRISELSGWERGMMLLLSAAHDGADAVFDRLEEARREFEKLGERFGLSSTLRILAEHHARHGDLPAAVAALTRAIGPIEELGVAADGAEVFAELATALTRMKQLDRAQIALQRAWERAEESRETRTMAYVRMARGEFLIRRGDREAARRELDIAESGFAHTALEARVRVWCAGLRAMIAVLDGNAMTARRMLDAAIARGVDGVAMPGLAAVAHMYAAVAVLDGVPERAAYLVGVAAGLIGTEDRRGYDNLVRPAERARELLGARAYTAAYDRGAALTHDAAIEVIRSDPLRAQPCGSRPSPTELREER